ncbi:hypothetical protein GCAAIG_09230 [Candidatus Electronema halotolerans]
MFADFLDNLKVDNADKISLRYGEITASLNKKFRESESTFLKRGLFMNITLTPDIEQVLRQAAIKQGATVESIVLKTLRECFFQKESKQQNCSKMNSLADMLEGYIGTIDSGEIIQGGAQMSKNSGKKFADILAEKYRQGKI